MDEDCNIARDFFQVILTCHQEPTCHNLIKKCINAIEKTIQDHFDDFVAPMASSFTLKQINKLFVCSLGEEDHNTVEGEDTASVILDQVEDYEDYKKLATGFHEIILKTLLKKCTLSELIRELFSLCLLTAESATITVLGSCLSIKQIVQINTTKLNEVTIKQEQPEAHFSGRQAITEAENSVNETENSVSLRDQMSESSNTNINNVNTQAPTTEPNIRESPTEPAEDNRNDSPRNNLIVCASKKIPKKRGRPGTQKQLKAHGKKIRVSFTNSEGQVVVIPPPHDAIMTTTWPSELQPATPVAKTNGKTEAIILRRRGKPQKCRICLNNFNLKKEFVAHLRDVHQFSYYFYKDYYKVHLKAETALEAEKQPSA